MVYEERASSIQGGAKGHALADKRPRWMIDAQIAARAHGVECTDGASKDNEDVESAGAILGTLRGSRKADVNRSADRHTTNLLDVEPAIHVSRLEDKTPRYAHLKLCLKHNQDFLLRTQPLRISGTLSQRHLPRSPH